MAKWIVKGGGLSAIVAIFLIFVYLSVEVAPIFFKAKQTPIALAYPIPGDSSKTLSISLEERLALASRITQSGNVYYFKPKTGAVTQRLKLTLPDKVNISAYYKPEATSNGNEDEGGKFNLETLVLGLSNGQILLAQTSYKVTFAKNGKRIITPTLNYPAGNKLISTGGQSPIKQIAGALNSEGITLVSSGGAGKLHITRLEKSGSLMEDESKMTISTSEITRPKNEKIQDIVLSKDQKSLYVLIANNSLLYYDISDLKKPLLLQTLPIGSENENVSQIKLLVGGISLIVGTSSGKLSQWSPVRDGQNRKRLQKLREFKTLTSSIIDIVPEYRRKGFLVIDRSGSLAIYYSTSNRLLLLNKLKQTDASRVYVSPRSNAALIETRSGKLQFHKIKNEHPEISWAALWKKNWYESYQKPEHVWQSSASSDDFEPKFGLSPLAFGTLKAAFYAMLFATPLALLGAIYAAQFMAPRLRQVVKPSIEIMEALPTVIIGFLAGLWLAPIVEGSLAAIILMLLLIPIGVIAFGYYWQKLPINIRSRIPDGWESIILVPIILLVGWIIFTLIGPGIENSFFNGSLTTWIQQELGIPYSQKNAVVVGLAMGVAVIPTIFSIAEDALFAVPKHLIQGSLALGATQWQTLKQVVLLTASPGIFSAVMIGFGRAVGETMIVLMATGSTAIMDFSALLGMRTFSANIATEIPEAEVGSTHYRVLFLTALILFIFTFFFNTIAEVVRQRLRRKYSTL